MQIYLIRSFWNRMNMTAPLLGTCAAAACHNHMCLSGMLTFVTLWHARALETVEM